MKKEHYFVKVIMESWGGYRRRSFSALGLPKSSPAFDPANYEYIYPSPPSFVRKRISMRDEKRYRQMKQVSTKPHLKPRIPDYLGNSAMNHIDILVKELPSIYREVAEMKFIAEMKENEIALEVNRSIDAIEKRIQTMYKMLNKRIDRSYFRKNSVKHNTQSSNK